MITKEDLERDEAICEAAYKGEWSWETHGPGWAMYVDRNVPIDQSDTSPFPCLQHGYNVLTVDDGGFDWKGQSVRDALANAINRLPAYIAHVREMERRIAELEAKAKELHAHAASFPDDMASLAIGSRAVGIDMAVRTLRGAK